MLFLFLSASYTLTNIADEVSMEQSLCWYIARSYPRQFRVTSLPRYILECDQRHFNRTDGRKASCTDYFHFSSFTPSSRLFVSLRLFRRLLYRYRNISLQIFLSVGFDLFSAEDCQPSRNLLCFLRGENFVLHSYNLHTPWGHIRGWRYISSRS